MGRPTQGFVSPWVFSKNSFVHEGFNPANLRVFSWESKETSRFTPWNASSISQDGGSWQMTRFSHRSPRLKMYSSWCGFKSPSLNPTKTQNPKKTEPILLMLQKSHEHQPPGMYRTPGEEVEMENLPHVSYRISYVYNLWGRISWNHQQYHEHFPWTQNNNWNSWSTWRVRIVSPSARRQGPFAPERLPGPKGKGSVFQASHHFFKGLYMFVSGSQGVFL